MVDSKERSLEKSASVQSAPLATTGSSSSDPSSDKKQKRQIFSWAMYDFGNSAYSTTVMAAFFPVFFKEYWSQGANAVETTSRLGFAISVASLLVAIMSPTLGAMADLKGNKKKFLFGFTLLGVLACSSMGIIPMGEWEIALITYAVAMLAFNACCVFYDSLLPSIAGKDKVDFASSLGYSLGYLGGGILLAINVAMVLKPQVFGIANAATATKFSFISVAGWWMLFSIPLFRNIPEPAVEKNNMGIIELTWSSVKVLKNTFGNIKKNRNLLLFMMAYWLYIDGVYTVMTMAVDFGISIGFKSQDLIAALLITQFVGFPCAYLFGRLGPKFGSKRMILIAIGVYAVTVVLATHMSQPIHFYLLATVIGFVQGGVQALSRAMFARMTPPEVSGEYFGFFNLVGRFASIIGPALVGVAVLITQDSRSGMLGLLALFAVGAALLLQVQEPEK